MLKLTHISLASFLWDIGKQNYSRCDAPKRGVPSGAILFAKLTSDAPKNGSGLAHLIRMGKSIRLFWINYKQILLTLPHPYLEHMIATV